MEYFLLFLVPLQPLHYLYKNYCRATISYHGGTINPIVKSMFMKPL